MIHDLSIETVALEQRDSLRFAIVRSTYHDRLNRNLVEACRAVLNHNGISDDRIDVLLSPGSWELPLLTRRLAQTGRYAGIAVFGVLVKGDTYHFDMIANEVARSLMETQIQCMVPVGFEVLAVSDIAHAERRAGQDQFNKGYEAGNAILKAAAALQEAGRVAGTATATRTGA